MKTFGVAVLTVLLTSQASLLGGPLGEPHSQKPYGIGSSYIQSSWLDLNRVKINVTNRGSLNNPPGGVGGAYWPDTTNLSQNVILFDFGPWVVGKLDGVPRMGLSQWGSSYSPGPIINGQAALIVQPADSFRYRPYKITKGDDASSNPDYRDWPVDLGAPVDNQGKPLILGDQMVWTVFNNLDTSAPSNWWQTHMPLPGLPVEIQQSVFEQRPNDANTLLNNVAFIEWTIINAGDAAIESTYVSLWTDIDFGNTPDNRPAVDTVNQLGYCWQATDDSSYSPPRAVGFVWLYGPSISSPGGQSVFKGNPPHRVQEPSVKFFLGNSG